MQYAATISIMGIEEVAVVLPLKAVPAFDPDNPPRNAYLVPEEVGQGWIKQEDGSFIAPPEQPPLDPSSLKTETS